MKVRERRRGEGRVYLRGKKWWVDYYHDGKQHREPTGHPAHAECGEAVYKTDKDGGRKAETYLANVMKLVGSAELGHSTFVGVSQHKVLVKDLIKIWKEKREADAERDQREIADNSLETNFKRATELWGDMRAVDLTNQFWSRWARTVGKKLLEKYEPSTINRWLAVLRPSLNYALKEEIIAKMPCDFGDIMYEEGRNKRKGFFEPDEFERLLNAEPDEDLRDSYTMGYLVGWRIGAIRKLRLDVLNIQENYIELPKEIAKERQKTIVSLGKPGNPLYELMHKRWKRRIYQLKDGTTGIAEYLFHRKGVKLGDIRDHWERACKKAGLMRQKVEKRTGKPIFKMVDEKEVPVMEPSKQFHDFRRTAARDIYNATGGKETVAMSITGHRTRHVFEWYNIITQDQKADAIDQTMAFRSKQGQTRTNVTPFKDKTRTKSAH